MATYIYTISDGSLYSWVPDDADPVADDATLAANGLTKVVGLPVLDSTHAWDSTTKTVITVQEVLPPKLITTGIWMTRFTTAERTAIRTSTDVGVEDLLFMLSHQPQINLNDEHITQGVAYLVSIGLLDQSRVSAILE